MIWSSDAVKNRYVDRTLRCCVRASDRCHQRTDMCPYQPPTCHSRPAAGDHGCAHAPVRRSNNCRTNPIACGNSSSVPRPISLSPHVHRSHPADIPARALGIMDCRIRQVDRRQQPQPPEHRVHRQAAQLRVVVDGLVGWCGRPAAGSQGDSIERWRAARTESAMGARRAAHALVPRVVPCPNPDSA